MHPGMFYWWKQRHHGHHHEGGDCGAEAGCGPGWRGRGPGRGDWPGEEGWRAAADEIASAFGVRRPLRFLAHKLELDQAQVSELAKIMSDLKTERAQAEVDTRRALTGLADLVAGATFDEAKAKEAGDIRVKSAEKLRDAVSKALGRIHAILNAEQRERLAYLIRTGVVSI